MYISMPCLFACIVCVDACPSSPPQWKQLPWSELLSTWHSLFFFKLVFPLPRGWCNNCAWILADALVAFLLSGICHVLFAWRYSCDPFYLQASTILIFWCWGFTMITGKLLRQLLFSSGLLTHCEDWALCSCTAKLKTLNMMVIQMMNIKR